MEWYQEYMTYGKTPLNRTQLQQLFQGDKSNLQMIASIRPGQAFNLVVNGKPVRVWANPNGTYYVNETDHAAANTAQAKIGAAMPNATQAAARARGATQGQSAVDTSALNAKVKEAGEVAKEAQKKPLVNPYRTPDGDVRPSPVPPAPKAPVTTPKPGALGNATIRTATQTGQQPYTPPLGTTAGHAPGNPTTQIKPATPEQIAKAPELANKPTNPTRKPEQGGATPAQIAASQAQGQRFYQGNNEKDMAEAQAVVDAAHAQPPVQAPAQTQVTSPPVQAATNVSEFPPERTDQSTPGPGTQPAPQPAPAPAPQTTVYSSGKSVTKDPYQERIWRQRTDALHDFYSKNNYGQAPKYMGRHVNNSVYNTPDGRTLVYDMANNQWVDTTHELGSFDKWKKQNRGGTLEQFKEARTALDPKVLEQIQKNEALWRAAQREDNDVFGKGRSWLGMEHGQSHFGDIMNRMARPKDYASDKRTKRLIKAVSQKY